MICHLIIVTTAAIDIILCMYVPHHVMLINWKNSSLAYLAALLLLCGDVSQNPGPPEIFSCGVCALEVSNSDAAVCCDYCDHWFHVSCDPLLSIDNYNDMVSNPSTEPWFCFYCKESLSKHADESSTTMLWVSMPTKFSSILLGVFYRCPLAPPSVLEALRSTVCSAVTHNQPVIVWRL